MLVKYNYAHKDVAYLNVIHNKIAYDEGNGWIYHTPIDLWAFHEC